MNHEASMEASVRLIRDLTDAVGLPGFEDEARRVMRRYLEGMAELSTDNLGSLIGRKPGTAERPRIMLAGHLDEIGFIVTHITEDGFIRFHTLGGWWEQVMLAQRVRIQTRKGDVHGVIGSKPPHLLDAETRKQVTPQKNMFIDVGARSRAEVEAFGVRPGDPVVPDAPFTRMNDPRVLMAKALDDRVGCALAVEVVRRLQGVDHPNTVYAVGTVQEEVGLRGAETATHAVQPDVGFALEVTIAGDMPGVEAHEALSHLGEGPAVLVYDRSMVPHTRLRDLVADVAAQEGIPLQFDFVAAGGTDAGRIHLFDRGVPSLVIGVPTRYIHTHAGIMHLDDFENAVRLLVAVIRRLDAATVESLRTYA